MRFRELTLRKNADCPVCGKSPTVVKLIDYEAFCGEPVVSSPPMSSRVPEITVEELKSARDRGEALVLVDVREPHEIAISDLSGSVKIPLGTLPQSLDKLAKGDDLIVYCRSGARSGKAVQFLLANGYARARNLTGGINRWAETIDPSLPRY
jgi:rhodanese-related sulfurtransferase